MDTVSPGFITRRRDHPAAIRLPAYDDGLAAQFGTLQQLHGNKKCVHIHVQNGSCVEGKLRDVAFGAEVSQPGHDLAAHSLTSRCAEKLSPGSVQEPGGDYALDSGQIVRQHRLCPGRHGEKRTDVVRSVVTDLGDKYPTRAKVFAGLLD